MEGGELIGVGEYCNIYSYIVDVQKRARAEPGGAFESPLAACLIWRYMLTWGPQRLPAVGRKAPSSFGVSHADQTRVMHVNNKKPPSF